MRSSSDATSIHVFSHSFHLSGGQTLLTLHAEWCLPFPQARPTPPRSFSLWGVFFPEDSQRFLHKTSRPELSKSEVWIKHFIFLSPLLASLTFRPCSSDLVSISKSFQTTTFHHPPQTPPQTPSPSSLSLPTPWPESQVKKIRGKKREWPNSTYFSTFKLHFRVCFNYAGQFNPSAKYQKPLSLPFPPQF